MALKLTELSKQEQKLAPGHRMCAGCAEAIIVNQVLMAVKSDYRFKFRKDIDWGKVLECLGRNVKDIATTDGVKKAEIYGYCKINRRNRTIRINVSDFTGFSLANNFLDDIVFRLYVKKEEEIYQPQRNNRANNSCGLTIRINI